ncbi:expressed unknown protein [Seminavis robusta]|uniref:DUF6824 domain-containing protein n=1 Tax=Seminavis robusta TaxID=568900 RepID=A0A9N8HFC1_9STRA|nr:expressed unknown protein [Seminavis robusta]|eukprot:Sro448_g145180.1 n/a (324) ;mRNA; r:44366-45337
MIQSLYKTGIQMGCIHLPGHSWTSLPHKISTTTVEQRQQQMHFNPSRATPFAMDHEDEQEMKPAAVGADMAVPTTLHNLQVDDKRNFEKGESDMPRNYEVKTPDVICGNRGSKETYSHPGNERFRVMIEMRLQKYSQSTRKGKSDIVKEIVGAVRDYGGHFVRQDDDGQWIDIGNHKAREKCGHAIRAALTKNKTQRLEGRDSMSTGSGYASAPTIPTSNRAAMPRRSSSISQLSRQSSNCSSPTNQMASEASEAKVASEDASAENARQGYVSEFERSLLLQETVGLLGKRDVEEYESEHEDGAQTDGNDQFLEYERMKRRKF